jgi:hypothetical protein
VIGWSASVAAMADARFITQYSYCTAPPAACPIAWCCLLFSLAKRACSPRWRIVWHRAPASWLREDSGSRCANLEEFGRSRGRTLGQFRRRLHSPGGGTAIRGLLGADR